MLNGYIVGVYISGSSSATTETSTIAKGGSVVGPVVLPNNAFVHVNSKKKVMVAQFFGSGISTNIHKDPAMLIIPAEEFWRPHYIFSTPKPVATGIKHYALIVIETTRLPQLLLDGSTIDQSGWRVFYGSTPQKSGKAVELAAAGIHELRHSQDVRFGVHLYGSSTVGCSYAYPAGFCRDAQVGIWSSGEHHYTYIILSRQPLVSN